MKVQSWNGKDVFYAKCAEGFSLFCNGGSGSTDLTPLGISELRGCFLRGGVDFRDEYVEEGPLGGCVIRWWSSTEFSILKSGFFFSVEPNGFEIKNNRVHCKQWEKFSVVHEVDALKYLQGVSKYCLVKEGGCPKGKKILWLSFELSEFCFPVIEIPFRLEGVADATLNRLKGGIRYLNHLVSSFKCQKYGELSDFAFKNKKKPWSKYRVGLQISDYCDDLENVLCFDKRVSQRNSYLVPDLHFFQSNGYASLAKKSEVEFPLWEGRKSVAFWRGSTTGMSDVAVENITKLPRYKLCHVAKNSALIDAKITNVVQSRSENCRNEVIRYLEGLGFMGEYCNEEFFSSYKYQIDIDGNVTAWGFLKKLLMGSCVLKVVSDREQWFYNKLEEWIHYVPVKQDMSDLIEKIQWCKDNDDKAREIARNGQRFADSLSFDSQMNFAAEQLLSAAKVVSE